MGAGIGAMRAGLGSGARNLPAAPQCWRSRLPVRPHDAGHCAGKPGQRRYGGGMPPVRWTFYYLSSSLGAASLVVSVIERLVFQHGAGNRQ